MGVLPRNGDVSSPDIIREGGYQPTSDPGPVPPSLIRRGVGEAPDRGDHEQGLGSSPALATILANPHRVSILRILCERDATPSELVQALDLSGSQIGYQLKALRDWKIIEIVGDEVKRGAVEHRHHVRAEAIRPVIEAFAQESLDPD